MNTETKKKLTEGLSETVKDYVNIDLTDNDKTRALKVLTSEIKILKEEESSKINDELRKERHSFDIENQKERMKLEQSRNKLEETRLNHQVKNDGEKLILDKSKQDNDLKKVEGELTLNKEKFEYERKEKDAKLDIERGKAQLEKSKFNHSKRVENRKMDLEMEKIKLEYAKLDVEKQCKLAEQKKEKRNFFSNIGIKIVEIGVPVLAYTALAILSLKLTYKDDGIVPSSTKDFLRKI